MSGEKNRKMNDPQLITLLLDRSMLARLDQQVKVISKSNGFKVSRSDLVRSVLANYLDLVTV